AVSSAGIGSGVSGHGPGSKRGVDPCAWTAVAAARTKPKAAVTNVERTVGLGRRVNMERTSVGCENPINLGRRAGCPDCVRQRSVEVEHEPRTVKRKIRDPANAVRIAWAPRAGQALDVLCGPPR